MRKREENNNESKLANKEPANKLIERRFARVKDWNNKENDSSKDNTTKNNSIKEINKK